MTPKADDGATYLELAVPPKVGAEAISLESVVSPKSDFELMVKPNSEKVVDVSEVVLSASTDAASNVFTLAIPPRPT